MQTLLTKNELKKLFAVFVMWRAVLFIVGAFARTVLAYHPSFPYADSILAPSHLPQWLYSWANFDGVHYLTIAEKGYVGTGLIQAFFPLLPFILMRGIYLLFGGHINLILLGLSLTNSAALLSIILWFAFLKHQLSTRAAWLGVFLLLCFPTSLFFGALYTESLFFAAVIGAFLAARLHYWKIASVLTVIATATRIVGIFLVPALCIELWLQWRERQSKENVRQPILQLLRKFLQSDWQKVSWILLGSIGLIGYMLYLWKTFGDPLYFLHVQSEFGAGRSEAFVIYPQVLWRAWKILLTVPPTTLRYYTAVLEFLAGSLGLLALLYSALKTRISYVLFALGAFFMPTFTGTFSSMPRYILVCFPIYLVAINLLQNRPRLKYIVLFVGALSVVINCILFIQGYWLS